MIKVKGQLGEMAKCLEDEEQRISDLARLFFTELSTKDNAIYNNLCARLGLPRSPLTFAAQARHHLASVGRQARGRRVDVPLDHVLHLHLPRKGPFLWIGFGAKRLNASTVQEKQAESIIEKLCQRFRLVSEPRQWQDIAYCLSLLPYKSERTVKKVSPPSTRLPRLGTDRSRPSSSRVCRSIRTSCTSRRSSNAFRTFWSVVSPVGRTRLTSVCFAVKGAREQGDQERVGPGGVRGGAGAAQGKGRGRRGGRGASVRPASNRRT